MNIKACLSHNTDEWKTPKKLYDHVIEQNFIDCFPYMSKLDQYERYYDSKKLYINPPFSHIKTKKFKEYIKNLLLRDNKILLLIPSRTDTKFFKEIYPYISYIVFVIGRLHFNDSKSAPFPTMLIYLRKYDEDYGNAQGFLVKTYEELLKSQFREFGVITNE